MSITLNNITKIYKDNIVLNNFNLIITNNKLYLFIGENGSGKSTCLKLIAKQILYKNTLYSNMKNDFKQINFMPDKFSIPSLMNTLDYLVLFLGIEKTNKKLNLFMKKYDVPNLRMNKLSKGTLQKVLIISTILSKGDLYIFDEPIDGLDAKSKKNFLNDLSSLINNGKTILVSTHNKEIFMSLNPIIVNFGEKNEK